MLHLPRILILTSLVLIGFGLLSKVDSGAADIFLEATRSDFQKIPIGILGFSNGAKRGTNNAPGIAKQVTSILKADLNRSQLFRVVDQADQPVKLQEGLCQGEAMVNRARKSGIPVTTWGRVGREQADLIMDACAFDQGNDTIVRGKRYTGMPITMKLLRQMVHRWADALVSYYTGESGIAQTKITYVSEYKGNREIYVMDYDGHGNQRVTTDGFLNLMPTWTTDQQSLVFTTYQQHDQKIIRLWLASGKRQILVRPKGMNITPTLSPNGKLLAYGSAQEGNTEIYTMNLQTQDVVQLTFHASEDLSPSWSPNGREIAFTSDRGGKPQIYVMGADGSNVRRLTFKGPYNVDPTWSPRGDWIAYVCKAPDQGFKLCRISPDGQEHVQITTGSKKDQDDSPSWSPDGRHLTFSSTRGGRSHIYIINHDGTGLEQLTTGKKHNSSPAWSPR